MSLSIFVKLSRPYDREPSSHFYGEPFDTAVDAGIGGREKWSSPRETGIGNPRAALVGLEHSIELHEDGPLLHFVIQHWDQIANTVNALSALVSAWAATCAYRRSQLPPGDFRAKGGMAVQMGDFKIESERNLTSQELIVVVQALASMRSDLDGMPKSSVGDAGNGAAQDPAPSSAQLHPTAETFARVKERVLGRKR